MKLIEAYKLLVNNTKLPKPDETLGRAVYSKTCQQSMMPDDQLSQFSDHEKRSLLAYLRGKNQTSLRATAENAAQLINGKDLSGWTGNAELWSVVSGEIVGKSAGLKINEFLVSDLTAGDF